MCTISTTITKSALSQVTKKVSQDTTQRCKQTHKKAADEDNTTGSTFCVQTDRLQTKQLQKWEKLWNWRSSLTGQRRIPKSVCMRVTHTHIYIHTYTYTYNFRNPTLPSKATSPVLYINIYIYIHTHTRRQILRAREQIETNLRDYIQGSEVKNRTRDHQILLKIHEDRTSFKQWSR